MTPHTPPYLLLNQSDFYVVIIKKDRDPMPRIKSYLLKITKEKFPC